MVWTGDSEPDQSPGPELLTDTSFEAQDALWQLGDAADCHYHLNGTPLSEDEARTGITRVHLLWSLIAFPQDGRFGQQMTLDAGTEVYRHRISWWMRRQVLSGPEPQKAWMRVTLWLGLFDPSGGGSFGTPPAGMFHEVQLNTLTTEWSYHSFLTVAPGVVGVTLGVQGTHKDNPSIGDFSSGTDFDDFSIKAEYYDADADPPTPTYDEDPCDPSAFSGDPENTSTYTEDDL
jgi:hypothetical protein